MEHDPSPIVRSLNLSQKPMEYDPSPIVRRKDRKSEIIINNIYIIHHYFFYYFIIIIFTFISIDMMNDYFVVAYNDTTKSPTYYTSLLR